MDEQFDDNWSFLLELEGDYPLASKGVVPVDLSEEDDWGDIEAYKTRDGVIGCKCGCLDKEGDEEREVVRVWEYAEDEPFNDKFSFFRPVSLVQFVRRLYDASAFYGTTEEEIASLKEEMGI